MPKAKEQEPEVKLHTDNGKTTLQIRVDVIANGFLVKMGSAPLYAESLEAVEQLAIKAIDKLRQAIK